MLPWRVIFTMLMQNVRLFCQENYGKADEACVEKVKELYKVLDLEVSFQVCRVTFLKNSVVGYGTLIVQLNFRPLDHSGIN